MASIGSFYLSGDEVQLRHRQPKVAAVAVQTTLVPATLVPATLVPATLAATLATTTTTTTTTTTSTKLMEVIPATQPPVPKEQCKTVAFLRIQKTASTTFGQEIMHKMCGKHRQQCSVPWEHCNFGRKKCSVELYQYHLDYNNARFFSAQQGRGCIVTLLRDPIERLMSEYFMLKLKHRQFLSFDQWDVHQEDIPEIDGILNITDISESFQRYLHHPRNPSRNRQTLYLLGFQRVACNSTRCGGNACICDPRAQPGSPGSPAITYDWEKDGPALLEKAKEHLRSLDAFGLVECFNESIEVISSALGWDVKMALALAQNQALHVWKPTMEKARQIRPSAPALPAGALLDGAGAARRLSFTGPGHNFWREFLHDDVKKEIREVNRLDVELVKFARDEFRSKYGRKCEEMP